MNQTHDKCKYFGSRRYCPSFNKKLMQKYFDIFSFNKGSAKSTFIKENDIPDIDKEFCNNCDSFKPQQII